MRIQPNAKLKVAAVAFATAGIGAAAGLTAAAASPSTHTSTPAPSTGKAARPAWPHFRHGHSRFGPPGAGRPVHEQAVVLNRAGTAFVTVTVDSGTVQSVSGDRLTIKEAAGNVTYRTVTLTIPAQATIIRDFGKASLSQLKHGDRVRVQQSSDGTDVFAVDPGATPWRHGPGGPGGHNPPTGPGGPPGPGVSPGG